MIENLQNKLLAMGNSGCLCMCYLYSIGIDPEELVRNYDRLVELKIIQEDCFVNDGEAFLKFFGSKKKIQRVDVSNKSYNQYIACYQVGTKTHFVVVDKNDNVIYNPYKGSSILANGVVVGKRVLI